MLVCFCQVAASKHDDLLPLGPQLSALWQQCVCSRGFGTTLVTPVLRLSAEGVAGCRATSAVAQHTAWRAISPHYNLLPACVIAPSSSLAGAELVCVSKQAGLQAAARGVGSGGGGGACGGGEPAGVRGGHARAAQVCQVAAPATPSRAAARNKALEASDLRQPATNNSQNIQGEDDKVTNMMKRGRGRAHPPESTEMGLPKWVRVCEYGSRVPC